MEMVIGRLKNKYRILLEGIRLKDMKKCAKVVQICAAMHNFVLDHGDEPEVDSFSSDSESESEPDEPEIINRMRYRSGRIRRVPTREILMLKYF